MPRRVFLLLALLSFCAAAFGKEMFQQPAPVHLDRDGAKWAEKTLRRLSLEEKVGQVFMIWARVQFLNEDSREYSSFAMPCANTISVALP